MKTAVKERPILFSGEMVKAILDGRKTMTRRIAKNDMGVCDECWFSSIPHNWSPAWKKLLGTKVGFSPYLRVPYCESIDVCGGRPGCRFAVGERLWVRETWLALDADFKIVPRPADLKDGPWPNIAYQADHNDPRGDGPANPMRWRPSIFMPRYASRITLEITEIKVERLQEISEQDAIAEGFSGSYSPAYCAGGEIIGADGELPSDQFRKTWNKINGPDSWNANPWVWAISFKRVTP